MASNALYQPSEIDLIKTRRKAELLLLGRRFDLYTLGTYLGKDDTNVLRSRADFRSQVLLEVLDLLPTKDDIVFCEQPVVDAAGGPVLDNQGNQEVCGLLMRVSIEQGRPLGFRWRCTGSHTMPGSRRLNPNRTHGVCKISPLSGTIFSDIHLPFHTFVKILSVFVNGGRVTECLSLGVSRESAVEWFDLLRSALATCAWHDQRKIGKFQSTALNIT